MDEEESHEIGASDDQLSPQSAHDENVGPNEQQFNDLEAIEKLIDFNGEE
jgi:hypothetical protein